ncbi:MAG: hypothetical protein HYU02_05060 [Thaumarchaeota archaeon]|nr:hypothetical protein [Nitrososphaerota archaeon]
MSLNTEAKLILTAEDQASGKIKGAAGAASEAVDKSTQSLRGFATGAAGAATAGFALFQSYDRIDKTSLRADVAQRGLQAATLQLQKAMQNENITAEELALKQENVRIAAERLEQAQGNVNQAMLQMAIGTGPALITMFDSVNKMIPGLSGGMVGKLGPALGSMKAAFMGMNVAMGPVGIALIAITVAVGLFALAWSQNWGDIQGHTQRALEFLQNGFQWLSGIFQWLSGEVQRFAQFWGSVWQFVSNAVAGAWRFIEPIVNAIANAIRNVQGAINTISNIGAQVGKSLGIPGAQHGGTVLSPGLVRVGERGEELVFLPKGAQVVPIQNNVSGIAEVHISIDGSAMDSLAKSQDHRMTITRMGRFRF